MGGEGGSLQQPLLLLPPGALQSLRPDFSLWRQLIGPQHRAFGLPVLESVTMFFG